MTSPTTVPDARCSRLHWALLAVITLLGGLNRIMLAVERPLWYDEAFSVSNSQTTSYADLLRWRSEDPNQPPLSFLVMKGSAAVLGTWDPWAVRLIPVIAGVLCIPSAFFLGKAVASPKLGLWAAAFAAVDPLLVNQSAQARMFSYLCLGVVLALVFAVMTVKTVFSLKYCAGLGLILGLSLWNNQLALVGCCAVAATFAFSLIQICFNRSGRPNFVRACWGTGIVFFTAGLIGLPAILDILSKRLGQAGSAAPPSFAGIMSEIFHSLAALEPIPYAWILVFVLAFAGILWLWWRQGAVVIPLVALGAFSFVFAVLLRQRHHFFAARYLTPLLPVVWIGLATFPALVRPRIVALAFQGLLSALLLFHALHSVQLTTAWKTNYEYLVSQQVAELRDKIGPGDRVVFARANCIVFGRIYNLPIDSDLQNRLLPDATVSPLKKGELRNSSITTWLIAARVKRDEQVDQSRECLEKLAGAYGVKVKPKQVRRHLKRFHFTAVRMNAKRIDYSSKDLRALREATRRKPEEPAESPKVSK